MEAGQERSPDRSMPELLKAIAEDTGTLIRKEVELAKQEVTEALTARVKAVAALAVGGVLALLGLVFLALAAAVGLDRVVDPWLSRLIVGVAFFLLTGLALAAARSRLKRPSLSPELTKRTVKEDVRWARAQLKR